MAIRFIDEEPKKKTIRFLDEEPQQEKPGFLRRAAATAAGLFQQPPTPGPGERGPSSMLGRLREAFVPTEGGVGEQVRRLANPVAGRFGLSRFLQQEGQAVRKDVLGAGKKMEESVATGPIAKAGFPNLAAGTAALAGAGVDLAANAGILTPEDAQQAVGGMVVQPALAKSGSMLKEEAIDPARRALGFTKQHLSSSRSATEAFRKQALANRTAEDMLNKGVLSSTGDPQKMAGRAQKALHEAGRKMDNVISAVDDAGIRIDADDLGSKLIDGINPTFADDQRAVDALIDDITALKTKSIPIRQAKQLLKERWGRKGFDKTNPDNVAKVYRKATDIIEREIGRNVREQGGEEAVKALQIANREWGSATNALRALGNKVSQELGNNLFALPTYVAAAGQMATGNVAGAVATMGIVEALRRRGSATAAKTLFGAGKSASRSAPRFLPGQAVGGFSRLIRNKLSSEKKGKR